MYGMGDVARIKHALGVEGKWKIPLLSIVLVNSSNALIPLDGCGKEGSLYKFYYKMYKPNSLNLWVLAGIFNVVCDVPEQMVTVSSNRSPQVIVSILRQVMGSAHIINYVDPLQPTFVTQQDRVRYTSYDDSYSYAGRTGYAPPYALPYHGRSYDNEFRPGYRGYGSGYIEGCPNSKLIFLLGRW